MEEEELTRTKMLEAIGTHLITLLFSTTLLNIIKNISSSSSTSLSSDKKLQNYFCLAIHQIETTHYLIP